jgi:nucleoid-associated protein YgaU
MKIRIAVLSLGVTALFAFSGCIGGKAYLVDKERVDQDIPGVSRESDNRAKTRKVLVVELVNKDKNASVPQVVTTTSTSESRDGSSRVVTESKDTLIVHESNFTFPKMTSETLTRKADGATLDVQTYVVQKDDTLQKISKKFYGSFNQWMRIYDMNRDVIKNPNALKSGVTLKIPPAEEPAGSVETDPSTETK